MINPHWQLVDLDPVTWRNIGRFISPGRYIRAGTSDEHALYALHDNGRVLNVIDTLTGRRTDLDLAPLTDPEEAAAHLFATGEWNRVHIVDRQHLAAVAHEAQADPRHDLTLDAYYRFVNHLIWSNSDSRYVVHPPRASSWHGWTYDLVKRWLADLPDPASVALSVVGEEGLSIGLIVQISGGLIDLVTTFEALPIPRADAEVSSAYGDRLWAGIEDRFAPAAALLLCTDAVFDAWIHQADKAATITQAIAANTAHLRVRGT